MVEGFTTLVIGVILGAVATAAYAFTRGFFQHFGTRAARATITFILPNSNTNFSDDELRRRTIELHGEIAEFQTRKDRQRSRQFWTNAGGEMEREEMMEQQKQQSIIREEFKGEFLKKFAPRLEMILQEYEKRGIEPDGDMIEFDSVRWWAQHAETSRILPLLQHLPQKLETDN